MEIDVAAALCEVLDRRKTVNIKGLGTLKLEDSPAQISEDASTISPPQVALRFYDIQTGNTALENYLKNKYALSDKKVTKAISQFSDAVINALANYGQVRIKGLAHLKREGGAIVLTPVEAFRQRHHTDYPVLPLKDYRKPTTKDQIKTDSAAAKTKAAIEGKDPLKPLAEPIKKEAAKASPAPVAPANPPSKPVSKASSPPTAPTPPQATRATAAKVAKDLPPKSVQASYPKQPPAMNLNEKLAQNSRATTGSTPRPVSESVASVKENYTLPPVQPGQKHPDEGIGCIAPILGLLGILLLLAMLWWGYKYFKGSGTKPPADNHTEVQGTEADSEGVASLDSVGSEGDDELDYGGDTSADLPETCIIITGVFSRYGNVERMERQLRNLGYDVHAEVYGSYTRVGLKFSCADHDLEDYIQKIRREVPYSERAWYLVPDLHVDYAY